MPAELAPLRAHAREILDAGLAAAAPGPAVRRALRLEGSRLRLDGDPRELLELGAFRRILAVGAGKAAATMGSAVEDLLGDRLEGGFLVTKDGHGLPLQRLTLAEAAHPIPDHRSVEAAGILSRLLDGCGDDTLILALISGGASALLARPAPGLTLEDKARTSALLLRSGADIAACNTVRKHLSAIKGGAAARRAAPATVLALLLSDVIGDPPAVIGSGPFAPDPGTFGDALRILDDGALLGRVPGAVRAHLEAGARGERPETPKPGDPCFDRVHSRVVASNRDSLAAARTAAEALGYAVVDLGGTQAGPVEALARRHLELARRIRAGTGPVGTPGCVLSGGEPTVEVRGDGRGGRNQHLALAAVAGIAGIPNALLLSAGTDGTDGPTDAAGALIDTATAARARAAGLDPAASLRAFDAYPFFEALGDLLITGPTGTNVMDLHLTLIG